MLSAHSIGIFQTHRLPTSEGIYDPNANSWDPPESERLGMQVLHVVYTKAAAGAVKSSSLRAKLTSFGALRAISDGTTAWKELKREGSADRVYFVRQKYGPATR
jgi:hypothetical protein